MLTESCVNVFLPSRAVFSAILRDEYLTSAVDFQNGEQQSRSGSDKPGSEEIVYSRFIKIPLG